MADMTLIMQMGKMYARRLAAGGMKKSVEAKHFLTKREEPDMYAFE